MFTTVYYFIMFQNRVGTELSVREDLSVLRAIGLERDADSIVLHSGRARTWANRTRVQMNDEG